MRYCYEFGYYIHPFDFLHQPNTLQEMHCDCSYAGNYDQHCSFTFCLTYCDNFSSCAYVLAGSHSYFPIKIYDEKDFLLIICFHFLLMVDSDI